MTAVAQERGRELVPTFHPNADGAAQVLGPLEAIIMELAWEYERALTTREIFDTLRAEAMIPPSHGYTTITTTVGRLADKGYLRRSQVTRAGRTVKGYRPELTRAQFARLKGERVLGALVREHGVTWVEQQLAALPQEEDHAAAR